MLLSSFFTFFFFQPFFLCFLPLLLSSFFCICMSSLSFLSSLSRKSLLSFFHLTLSSSLGQFFAFKLPRLFVHGIVTFITIIVSNVMLLSLRVVAHDSTNVVLVLGPSDPDSPADQHLIIIVFVVNENVLLRPFWSKEDLLQVSVDGSDGRLVRQDGRLRVSVVTGRGCVRARRLGHLLLLGT